MTESILESISDGVFTVDSTWHITYFNRAAECITGINREEVIGKLCHEVFKSNMCESECPLRRTMASGKAIIDKKGYCVNPEGERIPISVSTALLIDEDGRVSGGAETFRDLREIEDLKEKLKERTESVDLISRNPAMGRLIELLPTIAGSTATILIEGETGTGKEVVARAIHRLSDRSKGPFIALNCGALPDTLIESELFGYKKGAFTGADKDKSGHFKRAQNGTLFLDEIGDIAPALQVKLLRVLQEHEYEALGATVLEKTNARLICATNKDLTALVQRGEFRQDLYYRIKVINLSLPPLRNRKEDIPHLAEYFLRKYAKEAGKKVRKFTSEVYSALYAYQWPGNIRELENVIERALVLCEGNEIDQTVLPDEVLEEAGTREQQSSEKTSSLESSILEEEDYPSTLDSVSRDIKKGKNKFERTLIIDTLRRHDYNCSAAAYELGIDKATLYRKIKAYRIDLDALRKLLE